MDLKPEQRVKLKGALPPNTIVNGLADMGPELTADPSRKRLCLVLLDVVTTTTTHEVDVETGENMNVTVPTLRVRAIEEVTPDDKYDAERLLGRAREYRQARGRNVALSLFGADRLTPADLLKHGSGVFTTSGDRIPGAQDGEDGGTR